CRKAHIAVERAKQSLSEALEGEEQAQQHYEKVHGRRLTTRTAKLLGAFYWWFIAVATVAEFPFNSLSFQLYSESLWAAWTVTGMAACTLIACGHFLGENLHYPVAGHPIRKALRVFLIALPLMVIAVVAVLRAIYTTGSECASVRSGYGRDQRYSKSRY